MKKIKNNLRREKAGWNELAEKSLHDVWNNEKDEKTWNRYGSQPKLKRFTEKDKASFHEL